MNAPQQVPTQGDIEQQMKAALEMQRAEMTLSHNNESNPS